MRICDCDHCREVEARVVAFARTVAANAPIGRANLAPSELDKAADRVIEKALAMPAPWHALNDFRDLWETGGTAGMETVRIKATGITLTRPTWKQLLVHLCLPELLPQTLLRQLKAAQEHSS